MLVVGVALDEVRLCDHAASMDHAVSLVQAYLQLNGYFTSAEYPIIASGGRNGYRTLTDIDVLAFRFPNGPLAAAAPKAQAAGLDVNDIDPGLGVPAGAVDMIIGEVKEGRVGINTGARDPEVLKAVVRRLGDATANADQIVEDLLRTGTAILPSGFVVRIVAFGAFPPALPCLPAGSSAWGTFSSSCSNTSANTGACCGTSSSRIRRLDFS